MAYFDDLPFVVCFQQLRIPDDFEVFVYSGLKNSLCTITHDEDGVTKEIWSIGGMTTNCIPTPIHHEGVVYLMSGFRGSALQAIRLEGARELVLEVDPATEAFVSDRANWLRPILVRN